MNRNDKVLETISELRQGAYQLINRLDEIQKRIESGEELTFDETALSIPLSASPHVFKGKKPTAVTMPDGQTIPITTWKSLAATILKDCASDESRRGKMKSLCGIVAGRQRYVLSTSPSDMDVPLKVDEGLYFEGKFDTEYLIKMMTQRIFQYVGYDYNRIIVTIHPTRLT